jgi:hypothetical protein
MNRENDRLFRLKLDIPKNVTKCGKIKTEQFKKDE